MNRAQNGEIKPCKSATVLKGQRSIILIVSALVIFAPGRFSFRRSVIEGVKIETQVAWALSPIVESKPDSNSLQRPWSRVLFDPVSSEMTSMG